MSAGQFREVDPDLLADYVGGALDGTPDEAVVARLIVEDPVWGEAHDALTEATRAVRSGLAQWGAGPEPMPIEVAERLTAALVEAGLRDTASPQPIALSAIPGGLEHSHGSGRAVAGPGRSGRRWRRWAAPAAIAAGLVAFAGFGIGQLVMPDAANDAETTAASGGPGRRSGQDDGRAPASAPSGGTRVRPAPQLVSSGTDYEPGALSAGGGPRSRDASAQPLAAHDAPRDTSFPAVPPVLRRLADHNALAACLDALTTAHAQGPLAVEIVDYATFQRSAALVVTFTNGAAERWVWVAGPQCGHGESGADTRYRARVE